MDDILDKYNIPEEKRESASKNLSVKTSTLAKIAGKQTNLLEMSVKLAVDNISTYGRIVA